MALQRQLRGINQVFAKYALAACVKAGLDVQSFGSAVRHRLSRRSRVRDPPKCVLRPRRSARCEPRC